MRNEPYSQRANGIINEGYLRAEDVIKRLELGEEARSPLARVLTGQDDQQVVCNGIYQIPQICRDVTLGKVHSKLAYISEIGLGRYSRLKANVMIVDGKPVAIRSPGVPFFIPFSAVKKTDGRFSLLRYVAYGLTQSMIEDCDRRVTQEGYTFFRPPIKFPTRRIGLIDPTRINVDLIDLIRSEEGKIKQAWGEFIPTSESSQSVS